MASMCHCRGMQDPALAANLRNRREAAGLTQVALASKSTVSLRTIQGIEKGQGTTVATLHALAVALGVSAGELLDHSPTDRAAS